MKRLKKSLFAFVIFVFSPVSLAYTETVPAAPARNPKVNCVRSDLSDAKTELSERRLPNQPNLFSSTYFLPLGTTIELALRQTYDEDRYFFGAVRRGDSYILLGRVGSSEIPANSNFVSRGLAQAHQTLITLRLPDSLDGMWKPIDLLIYTCLGSPDSISKLTTRVTGPRASAAVAAIAFVCAYFVAIIALRSHKKEKDSWLQSVDPVRITAGIDGRASLANLQILFFSLIVWTLLTYIVARTGVLSDLSPTVLMLMGITGVGSAAAKGADSSKNKLEPANESWLRTKGWFDQNDNNKRTPKWRDLFTSDGEFDVYRYQSFIFSLAVGVALFIAVRELSTFSIPETLLGILGFSQAIYITGKLVTPTTISELNQAATAAREADKARNVASATGGADAKLQEDYLEKARVARDKFNSFTGKSIPDSNL